MAEACLPVVTARIWSACCWAGDFGEYWKIGDYNYLVLSVEPGEDTSLYVQYWSEPMESVQVEVCSGERNPGALRHMGPRQREQVAAMGYAIGGAASNFGKEIRVRTAADAGAVAEEALRILFDVFGYRGQWSLEAEWCQGERADHDAVHSSLTLEDFAKVAAHVGFDVDMRDGVHPAVAMRHGRRHSVAGLGGQVRGRRLFTRITLETLVTSRRPIADDTFALARLELDGANVHRQGEKALVVTMVLRLDGGVTLAWLVQSLREWLELRRRCERVVRAMSRGAVIQLDAGVAAGTVVH
jgi:hypothetical protein